LIIVLRWKKERKIKQNIYGETILLIIGEYFSWNLLTKKIKEYLMSVISLIPHHVELLVLFLLRASLLSSPSSTRRTASVTMASVTMASKAEDFSPASADLSKSASKTEVTVQFLEQ
jgi:hypothetical protein